MSTHAIKNIFTQGPISPAFIAESLAKHSTQTGIGAHSLFLGQVRSDETSLGKVTAIEYSAYEEMVLERMHEIREGIFSKYPLTCLHVHHSLGLVQAGDISLMVFASSVHRVAAMNACSEVVEAIKASLPIWGKELLDTQDVRWKENK
jgi:molybdopterin synthase catalytic subunit